MENEVAKSNIEMILTNDPSDSNADPIEIVKSDEIHSVST